MSEIELYSDVRVISKEDARYGQTGVVDSITDTDYGPIIWVRFSDDVAELFDDGMLVSVEK